MINTISAVYENKERAALSTFCEPWYMSAALNLALHNLFITLNEIAVSIGEKPVSSQEKLAHCSVVKLLGNARINPLLLEEAMRLFDEYLPFLLMMQNNGDDKLRSGESGAYMGSAHQYCYSLNKLISLLYAARKHYVFYTDAQLLEADEEVVAWINTVWKRKAAPTDQFIFQQGGCWTEPGLVFFTCLFLKKEEAVRFLEGVAAMEMQEITWHTAVGELLGRLGLHMPEEGMEAGANRQAVFTQLCAGPLDGKLVLFGKDERFTRLVLQYLDSTEAMPHVWFGVQLGRYFEGRSSKTKTVSNAAGLPGRSLTGYGRLVAFDKSKRPDAFEALVKTPVELAAQPDMAYIHACVPHYRVDARYVHLWLNRGGEAQWPLLHALAVDMAPYALLPVQELAALLLYHLLQKRSGTGIPVGQVITSHINRVKSFLKDVKSGKVSVMAEVPCVKPVGLVMGLADRQKYEKRYKKLEKLLEKYLLKPAHLPEEITAYLLHLKPAEAEQRAMTLLRQMKEEAVLRLRRLDTQLAACRKEGEAYYSKIDAAALAGVLTEDILTLQPVLQQHPDGTAADKSSHLVFQILKSRLTCFAENKAHLKAFFKACQLMTTQDAHPFLQRININTCKDVVAFYTSYFEAKIAFVNRCLSKGDWQMYHFLADEPVQKDVLDSADDFLHAPFPLPEGLLLDATVQWLAEFGSEEEKAVMAGTAGADLVHLINQLLPGQSGEEIAEGLPGAQHRLLLACIQDMLACNADDIGVYLAADNNCSGLLDGWLTGGIVLKKTFYREGKAGCLQVVARDLQLKDAGNFVRLLTDKRINNLCMYFTADSNGQVIWQRTRLEKELQQYEAVRLRVLQAAAVWEQQITALCTDEEKELLQKDVSEKHQHCLKLAFQHYGNRADAAVMEKLLCIYNALSDNRYPWVQDPELCIAVKEWEVMNGRGEADVNKNEAGFGIILQLGSYAAEQYAQLARSFVFLRKGVDDFDAVEIVVE